ncbi:hypothetical protein CesoFtcFv8_018731 [Champsocephalus esox]|uniref:Uncharacterized protein n=1 Tax=Champsocephalus esox TaxID=159716 RepID=A0AAN8BHC2_9TELE|nr:hypothetical protein CesoFtcFv8_018731 [Champsocephalus esox]
MRCLDSVELEIKYDKGNKNQPQYEGKGFVYLDWVLKNSSGDQTLAVSPRRSSQVMGAPDSSFRQRPPEKSELTSAFFHELHYPSSPSSEKQTENQFWFHEIRKLQTMKSSSTTRLVVSMLLFSCKV